MNEAAKDLGRLIDERNRAAYTGDPPTETRLADLSKHAGRFREWATGILKA